MAQLLAAAPATLISKEAMLEAIPRVDALMDAMKRAFAQYSEGRGVVAPVQHVHVADGTPLGDACVKSGYVKGGASWVVKVAGGWPGNAARGLSNSQGCMCLFSQATGALECVLADEGHLTDVRTAAAAALCVREFRPVRMKMLAVFGTGVIAKLVVEYLRPMFDDDAVLFVHSRTEASADAFVEFAATKGWDNSSQYDGVWRAPGVIVTCTPATAPIVLDVVSGSLVVALGADSAGKRELAPKVLQGNVRLLVDSISQCSAFGEAAYRPEGLDLVELGAAFANPTPRDPDQTIVCDLTGIAVQDVAIATTVRDAVARGPGQ